MESVKKSIKRKLLCDFNSIASSNDVIINNDNKYKNLKEYISSEKSIISVEIHTNYSISNIPDSFSNLREVYLYNTFINSITCNNIKFLTIHVNCDLKCIDKLKNLRQLDISKCNSLTYIDNDNVRKISAKNCMKLENIKNTRRLEQLYLYYCPKLTSIFSSMYLTSLHIYKCDSIIQLFGFPNINHLIISDCQNIRGIYNISNVKFIQLINCESLQTVKITSYVKNMYVNNCEQLVNFDSITSIYQLTLINTTIRNFHKSGIHKLNIMYSTNTFIDINAIDLVELSISRCMNLNKINIVSSKIVDVECSYCERLLDLTITISSYNNRVISLLLLGSININNINSNCLIKTSIVNNDILKNIKNLKYVNELYIENCPKLEFIDTIPNLLKLSIDNCSILQVIKNITIVRYLSIQNCPSILNIKSTLDNLRLIIIKDCNLLSFVLSTPILQHIHISNCKLFIINEIPKNLCYIHIDKTLLFNNLYKYIDFLNAIEYIKKSINIIIQMVRSFIINKYKNKISIINTKKNPRCNICLCDITNPIEKRITMCYHQFHAKCISTWLKESYSCPICKNPCLF